MQIFILFFKVNCIWQFFLKFYNTKNWKQKQIGENMSNFSKRKNILFVSSIDEVYKMNQLPDIKVVIIGDEKNLINELRKNKLFFLFKKVKIKGMSYIVLYPTLKIKEKSSTYSNETKKIKKPKSFHKKFVKTLGNTKK